MSDVLYPGTRPERTIALDSVSRQDMYVIVSV